MEGVSISLTDELKQAMLKQVGGLTDDNMQQEGVLHTFRGISSDSEEVALATVDVKFCLLR